MANFVFNGALGRFVQQAQNVEDNSPAAAVLRIHAWDSSAADDLTNNARDVAALEATAGVAEVTNSGYANILMDEVDITITINDTTNLVDVDVTDQVFTAILTGDSWTDLSISYDADGSDTDGTTTTMTYHDFVVVPNGGDITAQIAAAGFGRASG